MANTDHVEQIRQGAEGWNAWRISNPAERPDLSGADLKGLELSGASLEGVNLSLAVLSLSDLRSADLRAADLTSAELAMADLTGANLNLAYGSRADCRRADFRMADLTMANFSEANFSDSNLAGAVLTETDFSGADLSQAYVRAADFTDADLSEAVLCRANFSDAFLDRTKMTRATIGLTGFAGAHLSTVRDLGSLSHFGPSSLDASAILKAGELPEAFRIGVGIAPQQSAQYADCYIAYAGEPEEEIARRVQTDLRKHNVRSWLFSEKAAEDESLLATFLEGVRGRRTVILLLSSQFIQSESLKAAIAPLIQEESRRGSSAFLSVILDDSGYEGIPSDPYGMSEQPILCDFREVGPDDGSGGPNAWEDQFAALVEVLPPISP